MNGLIDECGKTNCSRNQKGHNKAWLLKQNVSFQSSFIFENGSYSCGEEHHSYKYRQLATRSKFWCVGSSLLFHTELLYVACSFETSANLLGEGQTRAQIPKEFFLYPSICLIVQYLLKTVLLCRTFVTTSVHFTLYRRHWKNLTYFQFNDWWNDNVDKFCYPVLNCLP